MNLIAEVYEIICNGCGHQTQIIMKPNWIDPYISDSPSEYNHWNTSTFSCPICSRTLAVPGNLISLVSDLEDFDEIEQHR